MTMEGKPKRGRPGKLTPELQEKICGFIRLGNRLNAACGACGITPQTYDRWMVKGRAAKRGKYFHFVQAVERAVFECQIRLVGVWSRQAANDWRAAQALLAARFPDWNPATNVNLSGGPLVFKVEREHGENGGDSQAEGTASDVPPTPSAD